MEKSWALDLLDKYDNKENIEVTPRAYNYLFKLVTRGITLDQFLSMDEYDFYKAPGLGERTVVVLMQLQAMAKRDGFIDESKYVRELVAKGLAVDYFDSYNADGSCTGVDTWQSSELRDLLKKCKEWLDKHYTK